MQHHNDLRITIVGISHEADVMLDRLSHTLDMRRGDLVDTLVMSAYHETFTADGSEEADPEPVAPAGASLSSSDPAERLAARFHAERHAAWRARQAVRQEAADPMPVRPPPLTPPDLSAPDWEDAVRCHGLRVMAQEDRYQLALSRWRSRRDARRSPKRA